MRQISLQLWLSHDLPCALKVSLQQHELQTTHYCSLLTLLTPIFFLNVETGEQMSSWTLHFPYQGVEWYDILWDVPHLKETENFPVPCIKCPLSPFNLFFGSIPIILSQWWCVASPITVVLKTLFWGMGFSLEFHLLTSWNLLHSCASLGCCVGSWGLFLKRKVYFCLQKSRWVSEKIQSTGLCFFLTHSVHQSASCIILKVEIHNSFEQEVFN